MHRSTSSFLLTVLVAAGPWCSIAQTAPAPGPPAPGGAKPQVLFERSTGHDSNLHEAAVPGKVAGAGAASLSVASAVTDAMRAAPVFASYDLEVHLAPAEASLAVEARLTLRNGSQQPLALLPLQLSSSLHMERVSAAGERLAFRQTQVASDADHTGKLEETVVALPEPLAPGASLALSVAYSGRVEPTAARLDQLEAPAEVAASSDWDRIGEEFTGLRGFGDVVWYPVCSVPALLGDGARLFAEIGRQRGRNQEALIAIHVTDEFTGAAPSVAAVDGRVLELGTPEAMPNASFPGVLRFDVPETRLGFQAPSLLVAERTVSGAGAGALRVYSAAAHAGDAQGYLTAAAMVEPFLSQWLGTRVKQPLAVVDLPVEGAQPSEEGDAVLVSLVEAEPRQIAPLLSREMTHTRFRSPRVWLDEGVSALLGNLYVEQTQGRQAALERLAASRGALALVEPSSPGEGSGQNLIEATEAIYYRSKALDVLWMLRDLAGDKPLGVALRAYDPAADARPEYFEKLVEQACGMDLKWFFDAWVYRDAGLPDLSIANVYVSRTQGGLAPADQWMVSLDIANDGYAETEVPVTVHSATSAVTERVRIAGRAKLSRRMLVVGEPTAVDVNDGTVPEVQASVHERLLRSE